MKYVNMRNLLAGVVCAGIAASIALGVRNKLTETAPVEREATAPAGPTTVPGPSTATGGVSPDAPVSVEVPGSKVEPAPPPADVPPPVRTADGAASPAVERPEPTAGEAAAVAQADGAAILRRAAAAYRKIHAMRADFTQLQENPLLRRTITSRGTFFQQQPDKFLMRFSEPAGDVVVGDGRYFWVYYPSHDAKQVIRLPASVGQGVDLQSQFIGDPATRFRHTLHGKEDVDGRRASVLTLVPVEPAGYRSLKVWIDDQDSLIRRFVLTNDNGVIQNFSLTNLEVNPNLDPTLFRFTPPAGATIIER